ncbi:hypothetical protein APY04_2708 [Hyphomicrobium sulfonivorans]|uniref:Chemotaxis protein MotC n=1 Tax=Hyphomicrobium sulfonivorans TaxID=121290 RepID=A0A109BBQ6_HYPSL|nr:hypothetical protein [Hyphomicrobium sulfonivorans]KWT65861.1 hypothetical protein APY04_2708 [Hyphomicrobium sulfonivorans]
MRGRLLRSVALTAILLPLMGFSAQAMAAQRQPYELVRELQNVQNSSATDGQTSRIEQRKRMAELAEALNSVDTAVWSQERNLRAAVIYVLSGGDPTILRRLIETKVDLAGLDRLVRGALAYSDRADKEALELLSGVDVEGLDRTIGGHVALVRAVLTVSEDQSKAFALFDRARVIAPGTIVEESALRRQAILAARMNELAIFEVLSSQYFRRFGNSIFARTFERQFAAEVVGRGYPVNEQRLSVVEEMLRDLPDEVRTHTCLALAEEGIVRANVEIVRFAARLAAIDAQTHPMFATRMRLFEASALLVTDQHDEGARALWSIDRSKLGVREEALLNAAFAVARAIAKSPTVAQAQAAQPQPASDAADNGQPVEELPIVGNAEAAMARADELLNGAP